MHMPFHKDFFVHILPFNHYVVTQINIILMNDLSDKPRDIRDGELPTPTDLKDSNFMGFSKMNPWVI